MLIDSPTRRRSCHARTIRRAPEDPTREPSRRPALALAAAFAAIVIAGAATPGAGAESPPSGEPTDPRLQMGERIAVSWILVPVVVQSDGEHARGLVRDDFQLFVDARRIPIESFDQGADAAVDLVFLQDLSGSMELDRRLELSRRAIDCLLAGDGDDSHFALATFTTGRVTVDVPFTSDRDRLRAASDGWRAYGTTAIHDAVTWLPDIAIVDGNPRRAAVVITDGVDNASSIAPEAARERLRGADLPVYVIALEHPLPQDGESTYRYGDVLRLLAEVTGGEYHAASDAEAVDRACRAISDDLRYQYVLSFPAAAGGVERYRRLKVLVTGGSYQVTYRQGYQGRAPSAARRDLDVRE